MTTLEKRLSQLEESKSKVNTRKLTDAERVVRISLMLATQAPGSQRVREILARCTANEKPVKMG